MGFYIYISLSEKGRLMTPDSSYAVYNHNNRFATRNA